MRTIALVTTSRADWSSCLPLARGIEADPELQLRLMVTGSHLEHDFGYTVRDIERDALPIAVEIKTSPAPSDDEANICVTLGIGLNAFGYAFKEVRPDILFLVGDRLELLPIAMAATAFRIPIAHHSGGDVTEGAIDNQVRHALTKLSHLHFVALPEHVARVRQMGEETWRVHQVGELALDNLAGMDYLSRDELAETLGDLTPPVLLVTYHPTTLGGHPYEEINALVGALEDISARMVITYPGADSGAGSIIEGLRRFSGTRAGVTLVPSLGMRRFYSMLRIADAMVGNSSSGIWEAPSFGLPVVNVGDRQRGRHRAGNVIDVPCQREAIMEGIRRALSPGFKASLRGMTNPYGQGAATPRVLEVLRSVELGPTLLRKRFEYA